jgi:hypothetical protein
LGQAGCEVYAVGFDAVASLGRPLDDGLHQRAVGAAEIEECAVAVDAVDDHFPPSTPPHRIPTEPGAALCGRRPDVCRLEEP